MLEFIGDAINAGYNLYKDAQQEKFEREKFEYQKMMDKTVMQREDNALQRQMEDARQAGLSALSVTGGAGTSGTSVTSGSISSLGSPYQNTASEISARKAEIKEIKRANRTAEEQKEIQLDLARKQNEAEVLKTQADMAKVYQDMYNENLRTISAVEKEKSEAKLNDQKYQENEATYNDRINYYKYLNSEILSKIANLEANTKNTEKDTELKEWQKKYLITEDYWKNRLSEKEYQKATEEIKKIKEETSHEEINKKIDELRLTEARLYREAYGEKSSEAKKDKFNQAESVARQIMLYVSALGEISSEARGWTGMGTKNKGNEALMTSLIQGL